VANRRNGNARVEKSSLGYSTLNDDDDEMKLIEVDLGPIQN